MADYDVPFFLRRPGVAPNIMPDITPDDDGDMPQAPPQKTPLQLAREAAERNAMIRATGGTFPARQNYDRFELPSVATAKFDPADVEAARAEFMRDPDYVRRSDSGTPGLMTGSVNGKDYAMQGSIYKQPSIEQTMDALNRIRSARVAKEDAARIKAERESDPDYQYKQSLRAREEAKWAREDKRLAMQDAELERYGATTPGTTGVLAPGNEPNPIAQRFARMGDVEGYRKTLAADQAKAEANKAARIQAMNAAAQALIAAGNPQAAIQLMDRGLQAQTGEGLGDDVTKMLGETAGKTQQRGGLTTAATAVPQLVDTYAGNLREAADSRDFNRFSQIANDIKEEVTQMLQAQGLGLDPKMINAIVMRELRRVAPTADKGFWSNLNLGKLLTLGPAGAAVGTANDIRAAEAYNRMLGR